MRAFLLGASLAALLAGCAQQGELRITAVGEQESRADDGALAKAQVLLSRGEYALAVDAYRKAIRYEPANAAAYNGLAIAYDQLGRHDLSRRYYELALAYAPREAKYYRNLARSLERQGLKSEADKVLAQLATGDAAAPARASSPGRPSLRSLAQMASEWAATLADAASGMIRPHLERLSMGEVLLETKADDAPVKAARSITVPIPAAGTPVEEPQIAARPVGHSITVEIPPALPAAASIAAAPKEEAEGETPAVRQAPDERVADIPLATLETGQAVEAGGNTPRQLLATAADPAELLALVFSPAPECEALASPAWVSEYDVAPSGASMKVFTGDFTPMRLGRSGAAIALPLLYPASANLPVGNGSSACHIRMADAPPVYDALFSSVWLDWSDEDGVA